MVSIKTVLVREALALQDNTYYHYTHCKIPVLMDLIIEVCEVICFLHKRLKKVKILQFSILFCVFDCTWAEKRP